MQRNTCPPFCRLQASELVRHEVEQEKGILATANERLQCDLADAQQRCDSEALELKAAVATLQQRLSAEEQRSAVLQVSWQRQGCLWQNRQYHGRPCCAAPCLQRSGRPCVFSN